MNNRCIEFKFSIKPARMCGYEDSRKYVKKFKVTALNGEDKVGEMYGFIFNMHELMSEGLLEIFDETILTTRLFRSVYNGEPLNLTEEDIYKGFNYNFLTAANQYFDNCFSTTGEDDSAWLDHYDIVLGFVDSIEINAEYRGQGIGAKMMNMLSRFRNTVDFMVLQSFPVEVQEKINGMNMSTKDRDAFNTSMKGIELYAEGQLKIDTFYSKLGYKPFKVNGCNWMVMDKQGLRKIRKTQELESQAPSP
jgi:GNAT superfamily N-acetyltransferase